MVRALVLLVLDVSSRIVIKSKSILSVLVERKPSPEALSVTIRYADRLESAGWGGCLRRQMSLGETRQFARPAFPRS